MSYKEPTTCSKKLRKKHIIKKHWTPEEDNKLKAAVEKVGTKSWPDVAKYVENRNSKQCRERWLSSLSPDNNKSDWNIEDDVKLIHLFRTYGSRWKEFATQFEGRSDIAVKNRYNWLKRRSIPDYLEYQITNSSQSAISTPNIDSEDVDFNAFIEQF